MKVAALALATFSGFPGGMLPSSPSPMMTAATWSDTWIMQDPRPESSALDEVTSDLIADADDAPRIVLSGCDLSLAGSLTPESWARDLWLGAPRPIFVENAHLDKAGRWIEYEQIPRRPERPDAYVAYRYPLVNAPVVSGYDLDKPDDEQRRGKMNAVGHGGVDLVAEMGAPISMVPLEHQVGDAEVLYVGTLYGETVVTRHVVREGGADHDYLLIFGHLDRAADGVRRGRRLRSGATVGFVGNSASPALVHLHLEARRVRDRVDAWRLAADALHDREYSVVTDPRNVLPLRSPYRPMSHCTPTLPRKPRRYWLGNELTLSMDIDANTSDEASDTAP